MKKGLLIAFDPLEKVIATHSSILAGKIPWAEEPGRLQSIGLQRVRYNWVTKHIYTYTMSIHGLSSVCSPKIKKLVIAEKI